MKFSGLQADRKYGGDRILQVGRCADSLLCTLTGC